MSPTELGTILSVWAHPDDETYVAGGLMAAAAAAGQRVVCATASAGERGTDDPRAWPPARLACVRRWEAAAAMAVLGVREHTIAEFPDGGLAGCEPSGVAWVTRLIDAVQPDTIVTFDADGATFHPDHIAVHRWVTCAWTQRDRPCRLLYAVPSAGHLAEFGALYEAWGVYMSDARPAGVADHDLALRVHLHGAALDRKLTALRAMATQTAAALDELGAERYAAMVAEESFAEATTSLTADPVAGLAG